MLARLLLKDVHLGGGLAIGAVDGDRVPLVDDDDDRASRFVGVARDGGIESGDAFGGVDHDEGEISGFEVLAGHYYAKLFGHQVGLALVVVVGGVVVVVGLVF